MVVLSFIRNDFVRLHCDSCHMSVDLKNNLLKLVNFCVATLILKMKKIHNLFSLLCFIISRKVKTQPKHTKRLVQYMEKGPWLIECGKTGLWSFSLVNAPQLGRPVEGGGDKIKTLLENSQLYTMWDIANVLRILKSIKLLVKMRNVLLFYGKKQTDFLANAIFPPVIKLFYSVCPLLIPAG